MSAADSDTIHICDAVALIRNLTDFRADRFSFISDRPRLPYMEAIVLERLRWNLVAPFGDYCDDILLVQLTSTGLPY
jgi:hypothetical protein